MEVAWLSSLVVVVVVGVMIDELAGVMTRLCALSSNPQECYVEEY